MKHLAAAALSLLLLLAACGRTAAPPPPAEPAPAPTVTPTAQDAVRAQLAEADAPCAAAYLGFQMDTLSPEFDPARAAQFYPWAEGAAYLNAGGENVFLLLPAHADDRLTVTALELTDAGIAERGLLYAADGAPLLLRCNVSDIFPNALVRVTAADGSVLEFSPTVSLRDGALSAPGTLDLTDYPAGFVHDAD